MIENINELKAIHAQACAAVMKIDRTLTPDVDAFWPLYLQTALNLDNVAGQAEKIAPVQGYTPGIPWSLHLEAYDAYSKRWSPQPAMIDLEGRNCRGGFSTGELDDFIPGWRDRVSEIGKLKARVADLEAQVAARPPFEEQAEAVRVAERIEAIMEQAQVYASAWSLVGGVFDSGNALETAAQEKANLRALLAGRSGDDAAQADAVRVEWISVTDQLPRSEWDKYYHDDFSEPVAVMIDFEGAVRRSEMTWRYSFAYGGWVGAGLREGYKPSDYEDFGRVTHWSPLPAPLAAPAASAGDQEAGS